MTLRAATVNASQHAARRVLQQHFAGMDLMEFVPAVSTGYEAPKHLAPLVDLFGESLTRAGIRGVTSVPPQHGKSETLFHLFVLALLRDPTKRHLYATYSIDFAKEQSLKAAKIAERAFLPLDRSTMGEWRTPQGGGILWTGRGGQLTGRPVDGVAVIDDPLKNWAEANSPTIRERAVNMVREVIQRLHPGASLILNATRWHQNDPSGYFTRQGWKHVNLPAILGTGEPLWPTARPLWFLEQQRHDVGPHDWNALFMGNPQPRENAVFQRLMTYDHLPAEGGYHEAVGFDGAYTESSRADWSVALKGRLYERSRDDWAIYVTDAVRVQLEPDLVIQRLKDAKIRRVTWRRSGTEKGMAAFMRREGIEVREVQATGDKYVAAQPVAGDWRRGRILFPANAPWLPEVEAEILAFTGSKVDEHDDVVDALGSLHHELVLYRGPDVDAVRRASGL